MYRVSFQGDENVLKVTGLTEENSVDTYGYIKSHWAGHGGTQLPACQEAESRRITTLRPVLATK